MLKKNLIFIFILCLNVCKSQSFDKDFMWLNENNKGIKQIIISKNDKVGIIQQFDKIGNPVFIKNNEFNGEKVFAVWYLHWNKENKNDKIIFGHSNIGFEVEIYQKNNNIELTYTYLTKDTEDFIKETHNNNNNNNNNNNEVIANTNNFNEFQYLEEIKQINDTTSLLNSKSYTELLTRKKYLKNKTTYNKNQQETSSKSFNYLGKIESLSTTKYSKNVKKIDYKNNSFGIKDLIIEEYNNDEKIISKKNGQDLTRYKYEKNNLKEKLILENNQVISKTTFIYHNDLLIEEISEDLVNKKKFIQKFEYNQKGNLIIKTQDENEGKSQYKYEYIYW